jgi:inner membrane protein
MPSSVGHALAGVAAAWTADLVPGDRAWRTAPPDASWYRRAGNGLTVACLALAAAPDLDLLFHSHRRITHSIGAAILAGIVAAIAAAKLRRPIVRVALMCAGAYATHLVLDWLAADNLPPYGIQMFWPFSDAWVISGWDLFRQTERRHFLSAATIWTNSQAILQEIAILGPPVLALWLIRVKALARFSTELSRRDHSPK